MPSASSLTTKNCARRLKVFSDELQGWWVTLCHTRTDWDISDFQPWNTEEEGWSHWYLQKHQWHLSGQEPQVHNGNILSGRGNSNEIFMTFARMQRGHLFLTELRQTGTSSLIISSQHPESAASRPILMPTGRIPNLYFWMNFTVIRCFAMYAAVNINYRTVNRSVTSIITDVQVLLSGAVLSTDECSSNNATHI